MKYGICGGNTSDWHQSQNESTQVGIDKILLNCMLYNITIFFINVVLGQISSQESLFDYFGKNYSDYNFNLTTFVPDYTLPPLPGFEFNTSLCNSIIDVFYQYYYSF